MGPCWQQLLVLAVGIHLPVISLAATGAPRLWMDASKTVDERVALLDVAFYEQFAVLDLAANALGFAFSNAGAGVVGY